MECPQGIKQVFFLMQAASREKRNRTQTLSNLLTKLKILETQHKTDPTPTNTTAVFQCRQDVGMHLITNHQTLLKKLKLITPKATKLVNSMQTTYAKGNNTPNYLI